MLTVHQVSHPVPPRSWETFHVKAGATGRELVRRYRPAEWQGDDGLLLIVNGRPLRGTELDEIVADGSDCTVLPDLHGPLIAVGAFIIENIFVVSLIAGLGFAYSKLLSIPDPPQQLSSGSGQDSPTYAWEGPRTTYGSGARIPILFGIHRLAGQVVASKLYEIDIGRDVLGLLIALGEGPFTRIAGIDLADEIEWNDLGGLFNPDPDPSALPTGIKANGSELSTGAIRVHLRAGTQNQSPIPPFAVSVTTFTTILTLPSGTHRTYTTNGTLVTGARIRINFAGLIDTSSGAETAKTVDFAASFRRGGSGDPWTAETFHSLTELRRSRFVWSFRIDFFDADQWEIRVRRVTADDDSSSLSTAEWVAVIEESSPENGSPIRYVNTALLGLEIEATESLQGPTPDVSVECWGVPVLHWSTALGFEGPHFFDGGEFWGRDPAWVLAAFLTNARWGLGSWFNVQTNLDLPKFEQWSEYCRELVDDGEGGMHPRYQFDGVIDDGAPAWEQVLKICRAGGAVPVLIGDLFSVKFEHDDTASFPRPLTQFFASSNIRDVELVWDDQRQRPNVIDVQILDEDLDYEQNVIAVEDPNAFGIFEQFKLGAEVIRRLHISAFGITRAAQARRLGILIHNTNRLLFQRLRFRCNVDGLAAEIGDRIAVETDITHFFDTPTQGMRALAAGSSTNQIQLDTQIDTTGGGFEIAIVQTDLTVIVRDITAPIGVVPPGTNVTFDGAAIDYPAGAVVGVGEAGAVVKEFVITAIDLDEDNLDRVVECLPWDPGVFEIPTEVEVAEGATLASSELAPVAELSTLEPSAVDVQTGEHNREAVVTWRPQDAVYGKTRVYARALPTKPASMAQTVQQPWARVWEGEGTQARIPDLEPGRRYEFAVVTADRHGNWQSPGNVTPVPVIGDEFPAVSPAVPVLRYVGARESGLYMEWEHMRQDSLDYYEIRRGPHWTGAPVIARTRDNKIELLREPRGEDLQYRVRTRHRNGLYSGPDLPVTVDVGYPQTHRTEQVALTAPTDVSTTTGLATGSGFIYELAAGFFEGQATMDEADLGSDQLAYWAVAVDHYGLELTAVGEALYGAGSGEARWRTVYGREATEGRPGADFEFKCDSLVKVESADVRVCGHRGGHGENTGVLVECRFEVGAVWGDWIPGPFVGLWFARKIQVRVTAWRISELWQARITRIDVAAAT